MQWELELAHTEFDVVVGDEYYEDMNDADDSDYYKGPRVFDLPKTDEDLLADSEDLLFRQLILEYCILMFEISTKLKDERF